MPSDITYLDEVRKQIDDIRAWLVDVETKLDRFKVSVPTTSVDEDVAAAGSVTAVHKALERELGVDRRTVLAKVERLVKAHGVEARLPYWSTDLRFAKYVAEREANGKVRLVNALDALKGAAA
jgi:hypothetical protein